MSSGNDHTHTVTYSDEETYFSYEINVYNGPELPHGIHNFPFSFTLPHNIPSSFESHVGNVRYEVKGQIVRDWKWDHRVKKMITGMKIVLMYQTYQNTWTSQEMDETLLEQILRSAMNFLIDGQISPFFPDQPEGKFLILIMIHKLPSSASQ